MEFSEKVVSIYMYSISQLIQYSHRLKRRNIMRKLLFLTVFIICSFSFSATLTQSWLVSTTSGTSQGVGAGIVLMDAGSALRGFDFSTTESKVFLASGTNIYVINSNDGTTTGNGYNQNGQVDVTGASGGTRVINKVKVADDGAIYACNLQTAIATGALKIYRWATSSSSISVAVNTTISGLPVARYGDSLGVVGSGVNTEIYVSGSAQTRILKFTTTDGVNFTLATTIAVTANYGGTDIAPVAVNGNLWVSGSGVLTYKINQSGTVLETIPGTVAATGWPVSMIAKAKSGKTYILKTPGNTAGAKVGNLINVTSGASSATNDYQTPTIGSNANTNATAAAAYDSLTDSVYFMITNNGYGKYGDATLPVELSGFETE